MNPHKHYDLKEVEAAMRRSFRSIAQEPKTNDEALYIAACDRMTEKHIAMVIEAISLVNDGVPFNYIVTAAIAAIGNTATFLANNFGKDKVQTIHYVYGAAFNHSMHTLTGGGSDEEFHVGEATEVSPVPSGRA